VTVQMDHPPAPTAEADWDLDITIVESGGVVDDLLRLTDDGCGTTCQSACTSCP
jgi:FxLD family lantipeptide